MTNTSPENDEDRTPTDEIPTDPTNEPSIDRVTEPSTDPTDESPVARPASLVAVVVEHETGHDECTLYPADADDEAHVTEWITAEEDSYVGLDSMR